MKILMCIHKLPPLAGGAENFSFELAKQLSKNKNIEVHILTFGDKKEGVLDGIKVHYIKFKEPTIPYLYIFKKWYIQNLIKKERYDLIHINLVLPWGYVFRNFKIKKIIRCCGEEHLIEKSNRILTEIEKYFYVSSLKKCDIIITPGKEYGKKIKKFYNLDCKIIPNGVDKDLFRPLNIKRRKNVILFVGRYVKIKGITELIEVANKLPNYKFWFVGDGPLRGIIKGANIRNLGFKTKKELVSLYNQSTFCVFPSYRECLPNVGLEAIACGKAVICTKSGFSEYIKDEYNGLIINLKNKNELKKAIERLMHEKKLRKKLEKNAIKTALRYDWKKIIEEYVTLYNNILKHE